MNRQQVLSLVCNVIFAVAMNKKIKQRNYQNK